MSNHLFCTSAPGGTLVAAHTSGLASLSGLSLSGQAASAQAAPQTGQAVGGPSTSFKPTKGGGNVASGEVLLVEAYAAMWLLALGLVLFTILKQKKLDARIAQLSGEIDQARQRQDGEGG